MPLVLAASVASPPKVETQSPAVVDDQNVARAGGVDHLADLEILRR